MIEPTGRRAWLMRAIGLVCVDVKSWWARLRGRRDVVRTTQKTLKNGWTVTKTEVVPAQTPVPEGWKAILTPATPKDLPAEKLLEHTIAGLNLQVYHSPKAKPAVVPPVADIQVVELPTPPSGSV